MHITGDATTGRLGRSFVGGKTHCQVFIAVCVPLGEIYSSIHSRICTGDHCHRERKRKSQILRFSPRATGKGKSIFHSLLYFHWWPLSWTVKEKIQNVRVGLLQSHRRVMAEKRRTKWSIESAPYFFFSWILIHWSQWRLTSDYPLAKEHMLKPFWLWGLWQLLDYLAFKETLPP